MTQLIPLTYASPNDLRKVLAPFISKSSVIVSYPPTGMLIVTDVQSNIKRLLKIVKEIDIPGIGVDMKLFGNLELRWRLWNFTFFEQSFHQLVFVGECLGPEPDVEQPP